MANSLYPDQTASFLITIVNNLDPYQVQKSTGIWIKNVQYNDLFLNILKMITF